MNGTSTSHVQLSRAGGGGAPPPPPPRAFPLLSTAAGRARGARLLPGWRALAACGWLKRTPHGPAMASALAQQLARLEHGEPPRQGSKPSLLYDEQQAAETDVATIHQLACGGAWTHMCAACCRRGG